VKTLTFYLALIVMSCTLASGQTYKVLWNFGATVNDGGFPVSSLIADNLGNLYGTTKYGGNSSADACSDGGCGTVFELSPNSDGTWTETVIYNFCSEFANELCLDGTSPVAGLLFDVAGNLYGTTSLGGAGLCGYRCGTVFELSPPSLPGALWTEVVLYSFCAGSNTTCQDGGGPAGQLIFDASGNLYGTTTRGGLGGGSGRAGGTVFELSPSLSGWTHTILYNFCVNGNVRICPDGDQPEAGVTFDKAGNLYGTTMSGGTKNSQGAGTVFEISPGSNGWTHKTLVAFNPISFLAIPVGTVSFDPAGNLYSTASENGVFELQRNTRKLRSFLFNITDGSGPNAGVIVDTKNQAIYGTTGGGGSGQGGVVFKIATSGKETVLYSFCQQANCADGQLPYASLIEDQTGNLYGTTYKGGTNNQGIVFEITP
jgi:uncharacterized repeat protein (TIGR03803 family)